MFIKEYGTNVRIHGSCEQEAHSPILYYMYLQMNHTTLSSALPVIDKTVF